MKQIFSLLCALLMVLSLAACGGKESPSSRKESRPSSSSRTDPEPAPAPDPSEPSFLEPEENAPSQTAGDAVIQTIPQEEQLSYFRKYIEPYYITGLMYSTWSDPEEIEAGVYMRFFIYTESDHYWQDLGQDPADVGGSVPAEVVEEYITSRFEVDPTYLRTAENFDSATNSYLSMWTGGIGGGPGVTIERIEKDGDLWKFVCRDESGSQLSVTLRMFDNETFHYVAGEGLPL